MCLAMPMKINKIDDSSAECEAGGLTQNIRIDFIKIRNPETTSWSTPDSPSSG